MPQSNWNSSNKPRKSASLADSYSSSKLSWHTLHKQHINGGSVKILLAARAVFPVSLESDAASVCAPYPPRLPAAKKTSQSTKRKRQEKQQPISRKSLPMFSSRWTAALIFRRRKLWVATPGTHEAQATSSFGIMPRRTATVSWTF